MVLDSVAITQRLYLTPAEEKDSLAFAVSRLATSTRPVRGLNLREAILKTPSTSGTPSRSTRTSAVGVLAGRNEGTLADCSVNDSILIGRNGNDGLVGVNQGSIINCHADITIVNVSTSVR